MSSLACTAETNFRGILCEQQQQQQTVAVVGGRNVGLAVGVATPPPVDAPHADVGRSAGAVDAADETSASCWPVCLLFLHDDLSHTIPQS